MAKSVSVYALGITGATYSKLQQETVVVEVKCGDVSLLPPAKFELMLDQNGVNGDVNSPKVVKNKMVGDSVSCAAYSNLSVTMSVDGRYSSISRRTETLVYNGGFDCAYDHYIAFRFLIPKGTDVPFSGSNVCFAFPFDIVPSFLPVCCYQENQYYAAVLKIKDDEIAVRSQYWKLELSAITGLTIYKNTLATVAISVLDKDKNTKRVYTHKMNIGQKDDSCAVRSFADGLGCDAGTFAVYCKSDRNTELELRLGLYPGNAFTFRKACDELAASGSMDSLEGGIEGGVRAFFVANIRELVESKNLDCVPGDGGDVHVSPVCWGRANGTKVDSWERPDVKISSSFSSSLSDSSLLLHLIKPVVESMKPIIGFITDAVQYFLHDTEAAVEEARVVSDDSDTLLLDGESHTASSDATSLYCIA